MNPMYTDYEPIVPSEKLPEFLFHCFDLYGQLSWIKDTGEDSFKRALQSTVNQYHKQGPFISFVDRFFLALYVVKNLFIHPGGRARKILFLPFKYFNITLGARKRHHVGLIVHGKDRLVAAKHGMGYIATSDLDQYLLGYVREKKITYLYQLLEAIEKKLRAAKPDYIILWNDIVPMQRAIALAAKRLGITTLEVHHGIYDEVIPMETGKVADYVLVWGKYFKDLYVKRYKREATHIYVLGYPYLRHKTLAAEKKNNRYLVCYLGQNFEVYNQKLIDVKIETVKQLKEICSRLGLDFIYRPHPGDNRALLQQKLSGVAFTPEEELLGQTINKSDILISFSSTALVEAAMRPKVALQLMNYPMLPDNLEQLGAVTRSCKTTQELGEYLQEIISAKNLNEFIITVNNEYVETRYNPTERFLEIIDEIEKRHANNA